MGTGGFVICRHVRSVLRKPSVKHKSGSAAGLPFAFEPATLSAMKHNSYFDGKVQSLAVNTSEGPATAGVIEPGKYTFKTDSEERMQVVAGTLKAKLPGAAWQTFAKGQFFVVPAHASFDVEAAADVAYLCHYKK
jgi:uncharacterized protein YaiE (UPF0345 family)